MFYLLYYLFTFSAYIHFILACAGGIIGTVVPSILIYENQMEDLTIFEKFKIVFKSSVYGAYNCVCIPYQIIHSAMNAFH